MSDEQVNTQPAQVPGNNITEDVEEWWAQVEEWRAQNEPQRAVLSSGLVVYVRKASLISLAVRGHIPLDLAGQVDAMIRGEELRFDPQSLQERMPVFNAVVAAIVTRPEIVLDVGPEGEVPDLPKGAIHISEIDELDRINLFSWANEEVAPFAVFPGTGQARRHGNRRRGSAVRDQAEPASAGDVG
jgi:hypothetical protein